MDNKETFNIQEAIKAQTKYCEEKRYPHFAPESGRCWSCHRNIYQQVGWKREDHRDIEVPTNSPDVEHISGISVEKAGSELITGCPHCNRSYCD